MNHDHERDYIDQRFTTLTAGAGWEQPAPTPYGPPAKAPMTGQAKALIAMAGLVIVGGSAVGVAAFSASSGQAEVRAQELALQAQQLEVERAKVNAPDAKAEERRMVGFQACIEKAGMAKDVCAQAFPAPGGASLNGPIGAVNASSASNINQGGGSSITSALVIAGIAAAGITYMVRRANKGGNPA
ncbi:hypothetical protein AVW11_03925 [Streptomyces amritsarensis]|uniref:Uncharacterized protein n=1 Tax=Streptomyces amritsarensis TaxID=681158 RepID=A0ABX3GAI9_9ACTN|nr:hypothetical protein [Streptomyces amritsarensis]OLZ72549.1 hypothetical protein AVW11_03925 [Streptomyces amritsarensis]